jgi:hypothetical protein
MRDELWLEQSAKKQKGKKKKSPLVKDSFQLLWNGLSEPFLDGEGRKSNFSLLSPSRRGES